MHFPRRPARLVSLAAAVAAMLFTAIAPACGQHRSAATASVQGVAAATDDSRHERPPIREYIHTTWDTLTRSTEDCVSLEDQKVNGEPVLYLPADLPEPQELKTLTAHCKVDIERLPRVIRSIADVKPAEIKRPGLLFLPHPYVVPGGRFNEQYGWDSYFIILGLLADGRVELARGMVDNFLFEIEHYGALLNANRTYYLTRSQPPLLAEMIREVHAADERAGMSPAQRQWFERAYVVAKRDYALWRLREHKAGDTGLARYYDFGEGPVIEMADDNDYYIEAIRWMLAHPDEGRRYLVPAGAGDKASCDHTASHVCATAELKGTRLSRDFYEGDRAMRESGFDTSFRFGAFSGSTHHYAPVCLNSLLYRYETNMADFAKELGRGEEEQAWRGYAEARKTAMNQYLWDPQHGGFWDYDFTTGKRSNYVYATAFYPLWAGLATPQQADITARTTLPELLKPHGLAMSTRNTGVQWDLPFGWAPATWFAATGLQRFGFHAEAEDVAKRYIHTVDEAYQREGTLREKYDVLSGATTDSVADGYSSNNVGFGWTNGVYMSLLPLFTPARTEQR